MLSDEEILRLRDAAYASDDGRVGALLGRRQGPAQEDSEVQRLRLEIAQLRERVSALESGGATGQQVDMARLRAEAQAEGYQGFVDLMSDKGGYP